MNDNFDFSNEPQNEIYMSDIERKSHKRIFSKLGFAFLAYLLTSQLVSIGAGYAIGMLAPQLFNNREFVLILSAAIQYIVAFPIFYLCMRSIPQQAPAISSKIGFKRLWKFLVVSMLFMYVGSYISSFLMARIELILGRTPENSVDTILDSTNIIVSILIVGIIGPIFEELMFRKLIIDRLNPYGEVVAILLPSVIFGLFHGNLYQFFYAFLIGVVFSYIYLKTGKIIYTMGLHIFINMFCGILPSIVYSIFDYEEFMTVLSTGAITQEYIMANLIPLFLYSTYTSGFLAMVGIGIFVFIRNIKNIRINKGAVRFPKGTAADVILFNVGTIILAALSILIIALNTLG